MFELVQFLDVVVRLLTLLIFVDVILSWIPALGPDHAVTRTVRQVTGPILSPIRRLMPPTGGLDLSPIVAVMLLYLARTLLTEFLRSL